MLFKTCFLALLALTSLAVPLSSELSTSVKEREIEERQTSSQITYVNLAVNTGTSVHRASGILYGVPDAYSNIPSSFYTGMGFNYLSFGGAQHPTYTGWIWGGYTGRMASVVTHYKAARSYGAQFILKMSDLWGADGTQGSSAIWPYDNNSWTEYDRFLAQFVSDIKANSMTSNIKLLIWNEPDLTYFWDKGIDRYMLTWHHTANYLKTNLAGVPIAGPAFSGPPSTSNGWWTRFLTEVKAQGTAPNVYTWHHEFSTSDSLNDLSVAQPNMVSMLNSYGLTIGEFVIDEYGIQAEQVPGGAAWNVGTCLGNHCLKPLMVDPQLSYDIACEETGPAAGSSMISLLDFLEKQTIIRRLEPDTTATEAKYLVYKYYASTMTGYRVQTTRSTDKKMDSYAVVGSNVVRILVGGRQVTGTYQVTVQNLSSLGLATSGTITIRTYQFAYTSATTRVDAATDLGTYDHTYSSNTLSFPIYQTSTSTTWAFEFSF
ncbi:glycoside hydrolase superfamily [Flagelloscypha sp. PMI_526]|nr:glycoside hydrolase superfamily [Flagelloscypha sp. PMI_526]